MSDMPNSSDVVNDADDDAQMLHPLEQETDVSVDDEHKKNESKEIGTTVEEDPQLPSTAPQETNEETEILTETFKDITREIKLESNLGDDVYIQMKSLLFIDHFEKY